MTQTNTAALPGEFDALVKLRQDEPYFLLIARDRSAPELVMEWADRNRKKALREFAAGDIDNEKLALELKQCTEAEMIACDMRSYKAKFDADRQAGQHGTRSVENELPAETQLRDQIQAQRSRAASAVHNVISEISELRDLLDGPERGYLTSTIDSLQSLADEIVPPRPMLGAR